MSSFLDFPDRQDGLFGREAEFEYLLARARRKGMTAVVGRPRMGKTWVLNEVARRLTTEHDYLAGYHECKGNPDLLLRALSNLYTRWLADASVRSRVHNLWKQRKDNFVTDAGRAFGQLLAKLTPVPEALADTARKIFDGLTVASERERTGRIQLPPLAYDEALELITIIASISENKPIVLILDAWEKSPQVESEFRLLEVYLSHLEDWPECHIFAGIRNPEGGEDYRENKAYRFANDLARSSSESEVFQLPLMHTDASAVAESIVADVQSRVPAARTVGKDRLLSMLGGYPGVLERWLSPRLRETMKYAADMERAAEDAQLNRYREFDWLLQSLPPEERTIAVRLALFPRMDIEMWQTHKDVLLDGLPQSLVIELVIKTILQGEDYPTYGPDTRHLAAQKWFLAKSEYRPALRYEAEGILVRLADRVQKIDHSSRPFVAALVSMHEIVEQLDLSNERRALCVAATYLFGLPVDTPEMLDEGSRAATRRNRGTVTLLAGALINRGVAKGEAGDTDGALADYSVVIEMVGAPSDLKARACYNRGVARGEAGDTDGALADYSAVIEMVGAPSDLKARACYNRGLAKGEAGDTDGALADYSVVIEMVDAPPAQKAQALNNRGLARGEAGDTDGALADYSAVIEMVDAPPTQKAKALNNRGLAKGEAGDTDGALADHSTVIEMSDASRAQKAKALNNRGAARGEAGDTDGALSDFAAVIEMTDAPPDMKAEACYNRGVARGEAGDTDGALADFAAVIEMTDAPPDMKAEARYNRGVVKFEAWDTDAALADFAAVIEMIDAPPDLKAKALNNRGVARGEAGDTGGALADYSAGIEMADAPPVLKAEAYYNRGVVKFKAGDADGALADFAAVTEMADAPPNLKAKACYNRGVIKSEVGDTDDAVAD